MQARALAATTPDELETVRRELAERENLAGNGDSLDRWTVSTLAEVADFFGMSIQGVWSWRGGADKMPGSEGRWNLKEITAWRCDKLKAVTTSRDPETLELEKRALQISVEKDEIKLAEQRGELMTRKAAAEQIAAMFTDARNCIEAIPSEIGPSIPADLRPELTHQITQQVSLILTKMSQKADA